MSKPDYKKAWEEVWEIVALATDEGDNYYSESWLASLRYVADKYGIEVEE